MMTTSKKVLVVVFVLLAASNFVDFAYYGQNLRNLAGAAGFVLMAYGSIKNVNPATVVGAVLVIGSFVMRLVADLIG